MQCNYTRRPQWRGRARAEFPGRKPRVGRGCSAADWAEDSGRERGNLFPLAAAALDLAAKQECLGEKRFSGEGDMSVLLIAFGSIAAIYVVVLLGSPLFGSDH